ncbi:MAG: PilZ domain-containing protein [Candidatus Omnitrophica bacterium]|nr:PilZ domain-containing protein [Candidatus Omnitrophota bacterium]
MNIRVRESNKINIVDIEGRIDINASEIIETIGWLVKNRKNDILLNFEKVELVDYSGISILAIAYKNVINHKGKMKLCNVPLHIAELLRLVKLDTVFQIYNTEDEALNSFHFDSPLDDIKLRRRFKRIEIPIEVEFLSRRESKKAGAIWHSAKLLNISGDGIYLYTKKIMPLGEKLNLKIHIGPKMDLEITGVVAWLSDKSLQPQMYPGMGVSFNGIGKKDQDKILTFINRHITFRSSSE